jgi:hypothetical protein
MAFCAAAGDPVSAATAAHPQAPAASPASCLDEGLLPGALNEEQLEAAARGAAGSLELLMLSDAPLLAGERARRAHRGRRVYSAEAARALDPLHSTLVAARSSRRHRSGGPSQRL